MTSQQVVNARLARYSATLDPGELWPGVSLPSFAAAKAEVVRVTAAVLAGDGATPVSLELPSGTDTRALGVAALTCSLGPLLGYWCETGQIRVDRAVAELLAAHLDHGRRRAGRLRAELERVVAAFDLHGIAVLVLKGMHTGPHYFPDPGTRPMDDIDLLVGASDLAAAARVLGELGFHQGAMPRGRARQRWIPPGEQEVRSLELNHADNPWAVDLHVSLDRQVLPGRNAGFGVVTPSVGSPWPEGPPSARVLPQPLLLAYLALHASSHFPLLQPVWLVELHLVARRDFAGSLPAWAGFEAVVARTGTGRFVYPSLELAERLVPGTLDPGVRARLAAAAPSGLRRVVERATPVTAHRLHAYPLNAPFVWAASPREWLACLAHLVWPANGDARVPLREAAAIHLRRVRRLLHRLR